MFIAYLLLTIIVIFRIQNITRKGKKFANERNIKYWFSWGERKETVNKEKEESEDIGK